MELWDAYNHKLIKTGDSLVRGQDIPNGLFHLVVEAIIQATDGSILFMKRDSQKPTYPGYYEASAGGSALRGEDSLTAIKREIQEETGLMVTKLTFFREAIKPKQHSIYHHFHALFDGDKESVTLQENETTDFKWIAKQDLQGFIQQELVIPKQVQLIQNFLESQEWK